MPHTTIKPVAMPTRLMMTCSIVKVWIDIPRTMTSSSVHRLLSYSSRGVSAIGFPGLGIDKPAAAARHNTPLEQGKVSMAPAALEKIINDGFEKRDGVGPATKGEIRDAVDAALDLLDRGEA